MSREVKTTNLLGYEIAIARGFISEGLEHSKDWLFLVFLCVIGTVFVYSQLAYAAGLIRGWLPLAGLASGAVPGFATWWPIRRRLSSFINTSVLWQEALTPRISITYALIYHALSVALIAGVTVYLAWASGFYPGPIYVAAVIFGYLGACSVCVLLTQAVVRFDRRINKTRAATYVPSGPAGTYNQTVKWLQLTPFSKFATPTLSAIFVGLITGVATLATFYFAGVGSALVVETGLVSAICFLLTRIDYRLLHFSRFAGIPVVRCLAAHLTLGAIASVSIALACALFQPVLAAAALAVGIVVLWLRAILMLLYSLYPKRVAEFRLQFEVIVVVVAGFMFLPLGITIALARPVYLYRLSERCRWEIS